ncbi:hypothetical protein D3C87_2058060 [compost metagenome]
MSITKSAANQINCGSEPARDGLKGTALIQNERVIVNVHREHSSVDRLLLQGEQKNDQPPVDP